ncbi:MAG: serine/threonine protein kinase, partial [Actinobacteria bacterium]|nr:serine/threonine protein kinase [Actinomycetota bacterium]
MSGGPLPPRYRRPERIARGGMGEIYRAEDAELGRTVAVKLLADHLADDEAVRGRFTREGRAAARLSRAPNTVTIFDVGEHEGRPYIVMEFFSGGSLADRLAQEGAQPPARALAWLGQTAAALDAAHAHGVVHRDVKPANLLLDDEDRVHVADFGVASATGLATYTEVGSVVGTAGYLAPEQAKGEPAIPASDRYALAVVAFELLTGARPFARESTTAEAMAHVREPIPTASSLNPELPDEVDDVLERGLAKDPERRFEAAVDLV